MVRFLLRATGVTPIQSRSPISSKETKSNTLDVDTMGGVSCDQIVELGSEMNRPNPRLQSKLWTCNCNW